MSSLKNILTGFCITFCCIINMYANDISGIYANPLKNNNESYVEIFEKDGKYYGVAFAKKHGPDDEKDLKNPNKTLKERPVFGTVFLWNLVYDGNAYINGRVYNFDDGKEYYASIKKADDTLIKLRGSKDKKGTIGRTVEWRKVDINQLPEHIRKKRLDIATLTLPQ